MAQKQYIGSEQYRQMLVQDGERRFRDWHHRFLAYQQRFLSEMQQTSLRSAAGTSQTDSQDSAQS